MVYLIIVLRIIHIFCGIFWAGYGLFNFFFLQPTIKALGTDGQKTMQHLSQKTPLLTTIYVAATLTMLSGIILFWILFGFNLSFISSGYGLVLTIASVSGIVGWFIVVGIIRGIFIQMKIIGAEIQDSGNPPSAEQTSKMQLLLGKLGKMSKLALTFITIAIVGMSIARFVTF